MRTIAITALLALVPLTGCVYYECDGEDCWDWDDDWCEDDWEDCDDWGWEDDCDTDVDEEPDPYDDPYGLYLTPNQAEQGSKFLASIQAESTEVDFYGVTEVHINGGVSVEGLDTRSREVVLFLSVAADAELGLADIFVTFGEDVVMLEQGLEIFAAGSGHEPGDPDEPEPEC